MRQASKEYQALSSRKRDNVWYIANSKLEEARQDSMLYASQLEDRTEGPS